MAKESVIEQHGSEMISVARAKELLQGLNDKQNKTVQLAQMPADFSTLLSYSVEDPLDSTKTVTKTFKVGDRVVVTDSENGDEEFDYLVVYTLMKLYKDGNTDKALWAPGGAGGVGGAAGKVKVNLEAYVNDAKTAGLDLSGLTVTLTNTTDNVEVATKTWAGETLVFMKVTPLKNYSVSVQQKTGYTAPAAQTITNLGIGEEVTKTFQYEADEYTVGIDSNQSDKTDIAQAKVTYAGTPYGNGETFKVPKGTTVSLTASAMSDVTGYAKTLTQSGKTISAVYSANVYTVRFLSNQDTQQAADADLDRTSSGVQGYVRYQYGGETVTGGKVFHDGDTIKIPTDADTQYIELYNISNKTSDGYSNAISYDHVNKVLTGTYSTTKVFMTVTASQGDVLTGNTFKINGTNITPNDNTSFVKVPTGDSITVTAPDVSGYGKVITGGGTASGTSQTVTATYTYGVLRLTVSMSDSSAADLANVAPQISVNSGDAVAMTGSSGVFEVNLDVNDTYEITFNSLVAAGYQSPATISGTFGGGLEEKSATYQTTILTLGSIQTTKNGSVQGSNPQGAGVTVAYIGQSADVTLSSVNQTAKVPSNLTPTITPVTVYGYQGAANVSSGSISLSYATHAYTLNIATDQESHDDIASTVIRVTASGMNANGYQDYTGAQSSVEVLVPANVTPTAICQSGQPAGYAESISVDSTNKTIDVLYELANNYVDLGLPSGLKWATGNIVPDGNGGYKVGEETDFGAYVSWGNVSPHFSANGSTFDDSYNWGSSNTSSPYKDTNGAKITFSSQHKNADFSADGGCDAARELLGGAWRMPTAAEFQELYDNTDSEWTTINGVAGRKFMKKSDHSVYVFFPAAGSGFGSSLNYRGTDGFYWSSSLYSAGYGYRLYFRSSSVDPQDYNNRYGGFSVRAVQ